MSALDLVQISECLRLCMLKKRRNAPVSVEDLPVSVLASVLSYCDAASQHNAALAAPCFSSALAELQPRDINDNKLGLDSLPADVLLAVFKHLDRRSLGRVSQVCVRFRDIASTDCLWLEAARHSLASNMLDLEVAGRCQEQLSARDRVRVGQSWARGDLQETLVAVQNTKFMPRLQLDNKRLWVSWGSRIWCHPRLPGGAIAKHTTRVLRAHSDDVSKFVVSEGMVVSGGRDRALCGWSASSGQFLFARRYCHAGEITAVDVAAQGRVIVSGSRDKHLLVWNVQEDPDREACLLPVPVHRASVEDRVWSLATNKAGLLCVGTAATRGVAPLKLYDLGATGNHFMDLGLDLKNGAGMLDLAWLSNSTFLSCGYDTFTRLWDTRCGGHVRAWEEPHDESVYCLATDRVNCLMTGTARHGRVRVWDMRTSSALYMRHAAPARRGQSSPVYSLAMDSNNMYVALDQSLNHWAFNNSNININNNNNNNPKQRRSVIRRY